MDERPIDLTRMDEYPGGVIPNGDVETCLKVLRTIRGVCLGKGRTGTMCLSLAHGLIHDLVDEVQAAEAAEAEVAKAQGAAEAEPKPDLEVSHEG